MGGVRVAQQRHQRAPEVPVAAVHAGQVIDRRRKVHQLHQLVAHARRRAKASRRLDDERHSAQTVLERVLGLLHQAVVASEVAVVGEYEQRGIVVAASLAQRIAQQAELVIHPRAHAVVGRPQLAPTCLRPADEALAVANASEQRRLVFPGFVARARRHGGALGEREPRLLDAVRRVRIAKRQKQAQRLLARESAQKVDGAPHHGPVAVEPRLARRCRQQSLEEAVVVVAVGGAAPSQIAAVAAFPARCAPARVVFRGRAEMHIAVRLEAKLPRHQIVLAAPPDEIACLAQHLEQIRLAKVGIQHVVHGAMAAHVRIPARHEGTAARRADRRLREGVAERHRILRRQAIQSRRLHRRMAEVAKRVAPPLVGIEDHDVRALSHGSHRSAHRRT